MSAVDLDAYFKRIGWRGGVRPALETLAGILAAHVSRIPFENLDVLLERPIRLDLVGLQEKLVYGGRGGYCFEHATLLAAVLEQLGFELMRHTARVVIFVPRSASPRTHMFLTVTLPEGTFVVDPGFGAFAARVPIPLAEGVRARAGHETHWMIRDASFWVLRADLGGETVDGWISALEHDNAIDFEVGNHFTATHPSSPFVNRLMLSARAPDARVNVMNRDVTLVRSGRRHSARLKDRAALRALLVEHFGFDLPDVARLRVPMIPEWT
ncbi:MAG: arylamine N-acetyltransferase family protein [Vulcanimicrobiaceae bacterium]